MIAFLLLAVLGILGFIAPHHVRGEIFHRRRFYQHIGEMLRDPPRKGGMMVIMGIGLLVFLGPFYPAATVLVARGVPEGRVVILIFGAIACVVAAVGAPILMVFIYTPIGFGTPKELAPRTVFFYLIPGYLGAAAAWFLAAVFVPLLGP